LLAAICYSDILYYKNTTRTLPRASRALRGWAKAGPAEQRLPFPLVLLFVVAASLILRPVPLIAEALCLLIQLHGYLRPGEVTSQRVMQMVPPVPGAKSPYNQWGLNIAPFVLSRASKTGLFDESITLDYMPWAHPSFEVLIRGRQPREMLFPFSLAQLSQVFEKAVEDCQLNALRPCLYSLRHGGASEDFLRRRRSLAEIQRRGRWASDKSVKRYTKEAKLLSELHKIDPLIVRYGEYIEAKAGVLLRDSSRVLSYPQWQRAGCP
jgi:hypothetical protein